MSNRMFVLDVPENTSILDVAREQPDVFLDKVGPYFVVTSDGSVAVDRRSSGARHAVWYSWIAGLDGWRIAQWDQDVLRLEPR